MDYDTGTTAGGQKRCPKCGRKTEFENSGKFRVNAKGHLLDVWLIYRRKTCETSWKLTVYERVTPGTISHELYQGFLNHDICLAAEFGSRRELFADNKAGKVRAGDRIKDGQILLIRKEWMTEMEKNVWKKPDVDIFWKEWYNVGRNKI